MADDIENDDQWLYGEHEDPPSEPVEESKDKHFEPEESKEEDKSSSQLQQQHSNEEDEEQLKEGLDQSESKDSSKEEGEEDDDEKQNGEGSDKEDEEEEDSDDDINVVIGDIKTSSTYTSLNIKRGGLLTASSGDKNKQQQPGKFSVEEFDQVGTINGVPATEFNLDSLEEKPWRKPGADITDYFNYGFNEDTWRAYCERQKRLRVSESGVGLAPLNAIGMPRGPLPILNDNSKYSGNFMGIRKAGPPPGRRMTGAIDVIGSGQRVGASGKIEPPKENVIQVLTADRREYSRKMPGFPDLSVPPPNTFEEFQPEYGFNPEPEPFYGGYEPTQDSQWDSGQDSWAPQEIKTLSSGPTTGLPPPMMGPPITTMPIPVPSPSLREVSPGRERDRESRGRSEKPRDRDREKSKRRERSRSRSRRHRSRSRSPGHRSHKKKKSRRHEDSE